MVLAGERARDRSAPLPAVLPGRAGGAVPSPADLGGPADPGTAVSLLALQYAASLRDDQVSRTSTRLYRFGTVPRHPVHARILGNAVTARQYLITAAGLDRSGDSGGFRLTSTESAGWLSWRSSRVGGGSTIAGVRKVYVTATIDYLPVALRVVFEAARSTDVAVLKFGADYANLRRPDRIVIYTRNRKHAEAVAAALGPSLGQIPAGILPFAERMSAAVFTGLDPPAAMPRLADGSRSWRSWLCRALAGALHEDPRCSPGTAVDAALRRARELGIDPESWSVSDSFFTGMAQAG